MDNLTHSLAGWALGQAGLKTVTRKGLAALILGANMPDVDVFFGWAPWEPLAMHRGVTHSLVGGVVLMPPLLAGLLLLLDRWQVQRGAQFKSGLAMRPAWLLALCYLGALTHPLLDLMTTYSVQLLSPFSGAWYHSDGLFIIDIWLWLLLGGAIILSRRREQAGRPWARPVQAAIAATLVYIGINLAITDRAVAAVAAVSNGQARSIFASPQPALSWRRQMVWRQGDCYRQARFDPLSPGIRPFGGCTPVNLDDPLIQAARRRDPGLRDFLRWSVLPFASIERQRCQAQVTIGDARYLDLVGRSRFVHETTVPNGGPGC